MKKPKILFLVDVFGWAWYYKSKILQENLKNDFTIDIAGALDNKGVEWDHKSHDIYFTFGYAYIHRFNKVDKKRRITGVTAHRSINLIEPAMKMAGSIHANSMLLFNEVSKIHDNVYYLPNGVDEKLFSFQGKLPRKVLGFTIGHVGKNSAMKRQKDFLIPMAKKSGYHYIFHLNNHTNKIPLEEMPDIYKKMDVFVVNSYEDGTPNGALEAASCGVPIISNYIGNMPEFIKDGYNGYLIKNNNSMEEYLSTLYYLADNKKKLRQMGINARKTIEEGWTWEIQSENYRKMFKDIMGKS